MPSLEFYQTHCDPRDLTIVSVSYNTASLLRLNRELVAALNPTSRVWWLVVENTPSGADVLDPLKDGFIVLRGTRLTAEERDTIAFGSIHHAKSLAVALAYVQTEKVLILDPDCYLLPREWIGRICAHMDAQKLVFFGAPYHPERLNRFNYFGRTYTNFPTAVCMLVNRKLLQQQGYFLLDFTPPIDGKFNLRSYYGRVAQLGVGFGSGLHRLLMFPVKLARRAARDIGFAGEGHHTAAPQFASSLRNVARRALALRFDVARWCTRNIRLINEYGLRSIVDAPRARGASWIYDPRPDIGYQVYERYHRVCKSECCAVYYDRKFPPLFGFWKWLVPQSLVGYPKKPGYWKPEPFPFVPREFVRQGRWEQFYFQDEPFALHIGAVTYGDSPETRFIHDLLEPIISASVSAKPKLRVVEKNVTEDA